MVIAVLMIVADVELFLEAFVVVLFMVDMVDMVDAGNVGNHMTIAVDERYVVGAIFLCCGYGEK
jgi:hypothetical protein